MVTARGSRLRRWFVLAILLCAAVALSIWVYALTYRRDIEVSIGVTQVRPLWSELATWPTDADAVIGIITVWNPGVTSVRLASDVLITIPASEEVVLAPIYGDPEGLWRVCVVRAQLAKTDCADACDMIEDWLELTRRFGFVENGASDRVRPRCGCEAASCIEDLDTQRGDLRARFQIVAHPGSDGLPDQCRVEVALGAVYDSCYVIFIDNAHEVPRSYRRFGVDSFWVR